MKHRWTPSHALALLLVSACAASACGGDGEAPPPRDGAATTGGEVVVTAEPIPTGPPETYVATDHTVVMRLDMARVRASSLSDDIGALVRGYPTWQELLGRSGIEPVRDFDRVLVSAPSAANARAVMVIRHRMTEAQVRQAVLDMSVQNGARATWREMDGFDVVDWPAATDPPRVVVLTGDHEMVVTSGEDLERVIAVAHDHRLRRQSDDESVEPGLALEDRTIVTVEASEVADAWTSRFRYPPSAFRLVVTDDAEEQGRVHLAAQGTYSDAAGAEQARSFLARQRDEYAGHMMVRAVGLDRALREAEIAAEGEELAIRASFTEAELERVLGLVALLQMSGS